MTFETTRRARKLFSLPLLAVLALSPLACAAPHEEEETPAETRAASSSTCEWTKEVSATTVELPFFYDLNALYLYKFIPYRDDVVYKIEGEMPYSAYTSFTSYDEDKNPFAALDDSDYVLDDGADNPYVTGSLINGTPRNFTLYVTPQSKYESVIHQGAQNALAISEDLPLLMMRVYFATRDPSPNDNAEFDENNAFDRRGWVDQPTITAVLADDISQTTDCPEFTADQAFEEALPQIDASYLPPEPEAGRLRWDRPPLNLTDWAGAGGISPDGSEAPDPATTCTGYLLAGIFDDVKLTMTAFEQMPTFYLNLNVGTETVFVESTNVRYRSIGSYGGVGEGLSYPEQVISGASTDHVSGEPVYFLHYSASLDDTDVATIESWAGNNTVNVRPFPSYDGDVIPTLIYRNKETNSDFEYTIRSKVPCWSESDGEWSNSPSSYQASSSNLGNYAPYSVTCDISSPLSEADLDTCLSQVNGGL